MYSHIIKQAEEAIVSQRNNLRTTCSKPIEDMIKSNIYKKTEVIFILRYLLQLDLSRLSDLYYLIKEGNMSLDEALIKVGV